MIPASPLPERAAETPPAHQGGSIRGKEEEGAEGRKEGRNAETQLLGRIGEPRFKHGPQDVEGELHDAVFAIVIVRACACEQTPPCLASSDKMLAGGQSPACE